MPIFSLIIGLVILVLLLIAATAGLILGQLIWSGLCVAVVYALRPVGKRAKWIVGSVLLFPPAYLCLIVALVWWAWPDKYDAYAAAFSVQPSPTVVVHEGDVSGWGDSMEIELRFNATPTDIQLLTKNGLSLDPNYQTAATSPVQTRFGPVPLTGKDVYTGTGLSHGFASENALLIYDPATGEAWYEYLGVD